MLSTDLLFASSDAFLATAISHLRNELERPVLIGLGGAQGSGKSSTAARLATRLSVAGLSVVTRSLDDFYLTHEERQRLSIDVHPLLATRGVPGTHDIAFAMHFLKELCDAVPGQQIPLPVFDKAVDDRAAPEDWPRHVGRPDIILLEGWCVGALAQPTEMLACPTNGLERDEDESGIWRSYVNAQLEGDYAALFGLFDLMIYLRAPSFDHVLGWRAEQEAGLDRSRDSARLPMSEMDLRRFIAHYERLTCWMMAQPSCDILVELDGARCPYLWQRTGHVVR